MIALTYIAQTTGYVALIYGFIWWVAASSNDTPRKDNP